MPETIERLRALTDGGRAIPKVLKDARRWAPWRAVWNEKRGKWDKIPCRLDGRGISTAKPDTWFSFEQAIQAYEQNQNRFAGIGYVLTGPHNIVGVDLDNCVTVAGEIAPWAQEIVDGLDTYAEVSPSGKGLRILSRADVANDWTNHEQGIEVYGGHEPRFLTITGNRLPKVPADVLSPPGSTVLAEIEARYARERNKAQVIELTMPELVDELILPDWHQLDLPPRAKDFLAEGRHSGDRSRELFACAVALYAAGLDNGEVFTILAENQYAMEVALDHRRQDHDRALSYLWHEHCCKGNARAAESRRAASVDEFQNLGASPGAVDREAISFVDFSSLDTAPPPPREWVVAEWLPAGCVTSLFGRGGHGKSLIAQQLATDVANGAPFMGLATKQGPVVGLFAEDDEDELLRRGAAILTRCGLSAAQGAAGLYLDARAGKANTLMSFGPEHMGTPTPLMGKLRSKCTEVRPRLVVLDNIAQLFAGPENSRHEVTAFCNELTGLAREFGCAVLLLGHVAKAEGSEYSGSTAWDAAVRSRLHLERQDDGDTVLHKLKANYSGLDELRLRWRAGVFELVPPISETTEQDLAEVKAAIVAAIDVFTKREEAVSHLPTARNFIIKRMQAEGLAGEFRAELLRAALMRMLDAGELVPNSILGWRDNSRHAVQGLAVAKK